ncbi:uncharacterized protein MELLADRAFT_65369 [Melampsora larici-populina 98AG31]|uniref:Secreted protein n=1 Tax=Melampsora larici-populina (strain 98AG31 / pathotype 3-4-7) TaxID=747676 RepID=F4RV30_MELLP|nr:uncharacterized protein MELLADRAFT_65369 [Melampsora larici-populina 98AG31]EGG03806.1 secreted protein [Melampsora larici-populina 98AG31]
MKLSITLIVATLAASAAAFPAPALTASAAKLAVRSTSTEQQVGGDNNQLKSIEAKCWGNCGAVVPSIGGMHWGHQLVLGNPSFSTFSQFQTTFNNFVTISRNSLAFWQSQTLQAQQFALQFQQMITNFWQMLNQFQRGCTLCTNVGQTFQFQAIVSNFFVSIQQILMIIQRQYWNQISLFQYDIRILSSCIQVIFGITQLLRIPMSIIFNNINMNVFRQFGIQLAQFQYYNQQSLFNSIGHVSPYGNNNRYPNRLPNGNGNGYNGYQNRYPNRYPNGNGNGYNGYNGYNNGYPNGNGNGYNGYGVGNGNRNF